MNATKVVKAALVIAILLALFKLISKTQHRAPRPYALERYDNYQQDDEGEYPGADEDYEGDYPGEYPGADDGSYGQDEDYEQDYEQGDEDYEQGDYPGEYPSADDGTYGQDEDYETGNPVEHFTNAAQPYTGAPKGLMNVATDLLPKPTYVDQNFAEFAPKALLGQNFLETKKYIGVDTKGSSLRNANYDLRSSPTIPRQNVGPWGQSTIDTDLFRKPLE